CARYYGVEAGTWYFDYW
nr:immunoglobulin heavy chain junction region [Macaca mulatta]MOX91662.1 immunoglobulin heavy chain junction region [Macaca mulatta]MOX91707.1 immunoglobulin heavy chain junction region [Macaca mulatta]MOX91796.1 immunoglobulin heavy chain junction region [Macaca mulatta]MOX91801.1 immunoglobulin heavy chain junction region [Macaca mulatta]